MNNFTVPELHNKINEVAADIRAEKAILFGSYARGTQDRKSDPDIVFIKKTGERFLDRLDLPMRLLAEKIRNMAFDVLVYTPEEFQKMIDGENRFIRQILEEGITIYES